MQVKQVESKESFKMSLHFFGFLFFAVMPKHRGNAVHIKGIAVSREKGLCEAEKQMIAK